MSSSRISRRGVLQGIGGAFLSGAAPHWVKASEVLRFSSTPFVLGVASGSPTTNGIILWTRLLHESLSSLSVPVRWEIASDERMQRVVRHGSEFATPEWAHSVHIEVAGLQPGREYWYRFIAGGQVSAIGRTRTAPALGAKSERLRIAVASCQKYENGFYNAYRQMLDEDLDLVVHVGDYIYEYESAGRGTVRGDGSGEAFTLDDYRARYALYKSDTDLQTIHAAYPWLMTWDDHEVANDYAGDTTYDQSGEEFLVRRAAAYRAYYEHMPLPRSAIPVGPNMRLHALHNYCDLVQIHMLDSRQYRSPLACLGADDTGGPGASCAALFDAARTKLGKQQEAWLYAALGQSKARWNLLAQGTPMAHVDLDPGPGVAYRRDSWDGYPAARQRLLDAVVATQVSNPVVIDGDIHAFQVANLNKQANEIESRIVASEFTTTSITSSGVGQRALDERRKTNPNVLLSDATLHGYLLMEFKRDHTQTDLVTVDTIRQREAMRGVMARYIVENGKAGPIAL
jgi:alkaline phosphatase D